MRMALEAYLGRVGKPSEHPEGVVAAAEAVAARPWDVVHLAGILARCRPVVADRDLGLTNRLQVRDPGGRGVVVTVAKGQVYPQLDHKGRRSRGAFDTPVDMARRVVRATAAAVDGTLRMGMDTACGTGAFLLAMKELGVPEIYGTDLDELALRVAQVAVPEARLLREDALKYGPPVDMIVGNPPFVPPERQDKQLRMDLRRRFPWLKGRFDLVVPFAATAVQRARPGGAVGLVLPTASLIQPYGAMLRRRWVERHRFTELSGPHPFPGAAVDVTLVVMAIEQGPAKLPVYGIAAEELLRLDNVPLNPDLQPGDVDLVERIRLGSVPLSTLCVVDTGVVAHGPQGGKARLLYDEAAEGRVPYADAKEFFAKTPLWLDYQPGQMHRAKTPDLFERPKIVIQRLRGKSPVRAAIDRSGIYVGHTCTVVQPREDCPVSLERLLSLIRSPLVDALTRIERGVRLDLYPKDVGAFPVPRTWLEGSSDGVDEAWGLSADDVQRLERFAAR